MTSEVVKGTLDHAAAILADPSAITRSEMNNIGGDRVFLAGICDSMKSGEAETLLIDGIPAAQWGSRPVSGSLRSMWFAAREPFFTLGAKGVLFSRRHVRSLSARHPGATFECRSWSTHPDAPKWFACLGFQYVETVGKCRVFRYFP